MVVLIFEMIGLKFLLFLLMIRKLSQKIVAFYYVTMLACEARIGLRLLVRLVRRNFISYVRSYNFYIV